MKIIEMLAEQEMKRYESLPLHKKRVVMFKMDDLARAKGYKDAKEVKEKRPYIWREMLVEAMRQCYPEGV
ncbi:MAG: hypothetical protein J7K68_00205 [Candidatus Diapherotrites archaeon]|nr:hypothetical protein [Candidatus Diapherotrites archaeon]